jgi:hypothetical protein
MHGNSMSKTLKHLQYKDLLPRQAAVIELQVIES